MYIYLYAYLHILIYNNLCVLLSICFAVDTSAYLFVSHQQMIIFHSVHKNKDKTSLC
jgi:hypothetical protein